MLDSNKIQNTSFRIKSFDQKFTYVHMHLLKSLVLSMCIYDNRENY